jgi:hypothetical protein
MHHPFTVGTADDVRLLATEPWRARARAYDVVLNGTELGGGSIRISDAAQQAQIFSLLGIDDADRARAVRLPARGAACRGAAARGDRARLRPDRHAPGRRGIATRRDRLSEDHRGAGAVRGRAHGRPG